MGDKQKKTEDSAASNNHMLGYEDGGDWEVELDATLGTEVVETSDVLSCSTLLTPLIF